MKRMHGRIVYDMIYEQDLWHSFRKQTGWIFFHADCRIFQCDHHSLKLCHIHSAIVCTEVIPTQVSHGIPPVLWVSRCEYLSSQRVGQCGLFAAYSPTEQRERGEERCSDIIEYNPASTSSQKWWLITPLRPCITPTTKLSFRSCSVLHYSTVRSSVRSGGGGGTFQKNSFSLCGILRK